MSHTFHPFPTLLENMADLPSEFKGGVLSENRAVMSLLAWQLREHQGSCCKKLVQCSASFAIVLIITGHSKGRLFSGNPFSQNQTSHDIHY